MTLDQHLSHLLWLLQDNPEAWKAHCWHRAQELAKRPELADLPRLLTDAMRARAIDTTTEAPT